MKLTDSQRLRRSATREFAADRILPWAQAIDEEQRVPDTVLQALRGSEYLGAALPEEWGGGGFDAVSYGVITEEFGKTCSSMRSLLTVHNMSAQVIARFGDREQRSRWLPDLCRGEKIIAFALSEPEVGSAINEIAMQATESGPGYVLNGIKKWITFGQVAELFLVFAIFHGKPIALVVDRLSAGLTIKPITGVFGTRGAMLAELRFEGVVVPKANRIGAEGVGLSFVANMALDHGRYSVAWGSVGIMQACLDACISYTQQRQQGGHLLKDHQLIRRKLADMLVAHTAARALCLRSACLREEGDPRAVIETCLAKYFASDAAMRVATEAVHIHGANGCSPHYPVARYLRDATVMGIIEGSHEIHQLGISKYALQKPYLD